MAADEGVLDPDTRESIASGRRTAGDMLSAARSKGRRLFVVFLVVLFATIYAMRVWIWPVLKADLLARGASVVAITPFDVIMLQAKLGVIAGVVAVLPFFLYYAREPLKRRGLYPQGGVANWKLVLIGLSGVALFVGGVVYSYTVFFPVMFEFLAQNAIAADLQPTYSIVYWTQFILVLGLSFGVAAQLPLVMTALAYAEIVPYETFRDKWKYAVLGMFTFGAVFSPPDPFTQIMWAGPLVILYGVSLYISRTVVGIKRGGDPADMVANVRANAHRIAAGFVLGSGLAYWFVTDGVGYLNRLLSRLPASIRPGAIPADALRPVAGTAGIAVPAVVGGVVGALAFVLYYVLDSIDPGGDGPMGDPVAIDLDSLDAEGVRAAPPEPFVAMDEDEALRHANEAMEADEPEKARAILDRYDEAVASEGETAGAGAEAPRETGATAETGDRPPGPGRFERATSSFVDALREDDEEDIEDDIGGYYNDLAFIVDSLQSKTFRILAVFLAVMIGVFGFLYAGGLGVIKRDFLSRLPETVRPEEVSVVTLHPVEALVFEVKIATLLGAVATIPPILYYSWPALRERGIASGEGSVFFGWVGALIGGLLAGSVVGYLYVAPHVISYLVANAIQANMIIAYRVNNFMWLVFFTTVGVGLWFDIPIGMVLLHRAGIVTYRRMRQRWRVAVLGVAAVAAVFTPSGVLSMILVSIPVLAGYGVGLVVLWMYTLGGRRPRRPSAEPG